VAVRDASAEQRTPTYEQLHEKACIDCGSATGPFTSAGYVYTRSSDGGRLPWAVVACPGCRGGVS
jgi:hypothetical protein